MRTISYNVQVSDSVFADFNVEVIELAGPDYDFDVSNVMLMLVDDVGNETILDLHTLSHDEQSTLLQDTNDAIDNFLSDNSGQLLAKHADPNFLARLDGDVGYLH